MGFPFSRTGCSLVLLAILLSAGTGAVLLAFSILLGWNAFGKNYTPSAGEQYYQSMMLSLEGELTGEKEALIKAELARYDEAFSQIERIDQMAADSDAV